MHWAMRSTGSSLSFKIAGRHVAQRLLVCSQNPAAAGSAPLQPFSALHKAKGLPANVHLLSLHDDGQGVIIFRLIHMYQVRCASFPQYSLQVRQRLIVSRCCC